MANVTPERLLNESNSTVLYTNETAGRIGDALGTELLGAAELVGPFTMLLFAVALWRSDASTDVAAVIFVPTTLFLSVNGFLPGAGGIVDGLLIAVAAVFAFGLARYIR